MRAKPLSTNSTRYKMLIHGDSQLMIRRVKSLHVRDFSRTILNSIQDNNHYMKEDIKNVHRHGHEMLKVTLPLRHIYREHL
jgi:hypothetical protein